MTHAECHVTSKKYEMHDQFSALKGRRQLLNTNIDIAERFRNFPLFFSTMLDYRFRLYPLQYLLSRTSGFLKYLLEDYQSVILTVRGLEHMLHAYYVVDKFLLNKFFELQKNTLKMSKNILKSFFEQNKISNISDHPIYFQMLGRELSKTFSSTETKKKTRVSLEIDQIGSGPMLVALLCGNRQLALKCNMLPGDSQCVYSYVQIESERFMQTNYPAICEEAPEAVAFLKTSRKAQKFALMCFFYNQQHLNRTKELRDTFQELKGRDCTDSEFALFNKYSLKYSQFIDAIFPGLNKQLSLLEKAMTLLAKDDKQVQIRTIDDCLLS